MQLLDLLETGGKKKAANVLGKKRSKIKYNYKKHCIWSEIELKNKPSLVKEIGNGYKVSKPQKDNTRNRSILYQTVVRKSVDEIYRHEKPNGVKPKDTFRAFFKMNMCGERDHLWLAQQSWF